MEILLTVAEWLLPLLYLSLMIDYGMTFFMRIRTHVHNGWIPLIVLFHALFLVVRGVQPRQPPLFEGFEILSVIALATTAVYYVVERVGKDRRTGLFVFMMVFLAQYTSAAFPTDAASESLASPQVWLSVHFLAATFAYTALALAGLYGVLHLVGRRNIKRHKIGLLFDRMPPLELLGRTCWYALVAGLAFVTVAVVTGAFVFGHGADSPHVADAIPQVAEAGKMSAKIIAKIVTGLAALIVCAAAVLGKRFGKWADSRVSRIAVAGFLVVAILFVASLALSSGH